MTTTVTMIGHSVGRTTRRYIRTGPAPSICAAFSRSASTERRPARNSAMAKPDDCQTAAITMVQIAMSRSISQSNRNEVTKPIDQLLDAKTRIEQPAPHGAGDDEGHGHRVQKDRAQHVFAANALVQEDCQQ